MKNIFDFMKDKKEYEFETGDFTIVNNNGKLRLVVEGRSCAIEDNYDLIDTVEEWCNGLQIRICDYCGRPMDRGYTDDDGDFYNCEECFPKDMNERYGEGNWRAQSKEDYGDDCNYMGGFYEYFRNGEWEPEPSYYTEWN